jgi:hypothetical protein
MTLQTFVRRLPIGLFLLALMAGMFAGARGAAAGQIPQASPDSFSLKAGQTLNVPAPGVLKNDFDPEGSFVRFHDVIDGTEDGTFGIQSNGSFFYTPQAGFIGVDSFSYTIIDNEGQVSLPALVTITVTAGGPAGNQAPVAKPDAYQATKNKRLVISSANGVLKNDTDANKDPLRTFLVTKPAKGTLVLKSDGGFAYTPPTDFVGKVTFTYKAFDGAANSNVVTVTITVK